MVIEKKLIGKKKSSNNKWDLQWFAGYVESAGLENQKPGSSPGSDTHALWNWASWFFLKLSFLLLEMKAIITVPIF